MLHGIQHGLRGGRHGDDDRPSRAWEREAPEPSLTAIPLPEAPAAEARPHGVQACGRARVSCVVDVTYRKRGRSGEGQRLRRG
jgi:hypothetical protein